MQSKYTLAYIALGCVLLLSGAVLLINVMAQAPEKAQIVFQSDRDGNFEIYIMDVDGDNQRRLTNNSGDDWAPAWSPDGQRVVFFSNRDGNFEIYVMDVDGKNLRKLTNIPAWDGEPDWFDPAFARIITPVAPAGKLKGAWGWLKENTE